MPSGKRAWHAVGVSKHLRITETGQDSGGWIFPVFGPQKKRLRPSVVGSGRDWICDSGVDGEARTGRWRVSSPEAWGTRVQTRPGSPAGVAFPGMERPPAHLCGEKLGSAAAAPLEGRGHQRGCPGPQGEWDWEWGPRVLLGASLHSRHLPHPWGCVRGHRGSL